MTKKELIYDYMEFIKKEYEGLSGYSSKDLDDKYMDLLYELVSDVFKFEINNVKDAFKKSILDGELYVCKLIGVHPIDLITSCNYCDEYKQFFIEFYNDLEDVWNILSEICDGIRVEAQKAYDEVAKDAHDTLVDKGVINDD